MPKQIHLLIAAVLFSLVSTQTNSSEAQHLRSRQPLQAGFRWLGQGWSAGYHHRDPGHNTDYYNPWTAHNSMLISKMPGYQTGHNQYGNQSVMPGSPYSNYSNHSSWDQGQPQSIQPTFVPSNADSDEQPEDDSDNDSDNDFDTGDTSDSDSEKPASIRVDDEMDSDEDADFDDSSFDDEDADFDDSSFDDIEEESGSGTKASKTGFSRLEPGSFDALDLNNSFEPN